MTLVGLIVILVLVGVGLYLLKFIPMDATIATIIKVIVIVVVILWLLSVFGLFSAGPKVGKIGLTLLGL